MIYLHLVGILLISSSMTQEMQWTYDLVSDEANNRRIVHNPREEQAQYRGKKQSPPQEKRLTPTPDDDEDKKTLAQQVADGKYGLIQTELFASPVTRPGILSYEINPEVPKDNVNNLGGLQPEEIWLAENHLLVLKGGGFSNKEQGNKALWPPIDNYIAPQRQVKIPPNPKVPPPFPVQLKDGGPIEFIRGINGSGGPPPFFDPRFGPPPFLPSGSQQGNLKGILKVPGNFTEGNGRPPFPFAGPGIGLFPPAVAFLPPPGNFTELDEDDPSIYYPPPYDFVYHKDNTSHVPPGPLVPGIILPPPPNFFAPYEKTKPQPTKPGHSQRKPSKSRPTQYIHQQVHKITRPTKPPKPIITTVYKNIPSTTTTAASIPFPTTDSTPNEIQPLHTLPPNTPVGDWVPIPAPRPFYITGLNSLKPTLGSDGLKIKYELPKNGWIFQNSSLSPIVGTKGQFIEPLIQGWDQGYGYNSQKKGRQFTTTEPPLYNGFKPIFVAQNVLTTTTRPEINHYLPKYTQIKVPKEYYYYEEPQITENKYTDADINTYESTKAPPKQYYDYSNKHNYEVNTINPPQLLEHISVKNPSESGRVSPTNINYYDQGFIKPTPSIEPPKDYYFYKNEQKQNQGYSYKTPTGPTIDPYHQQHQYVTNSNQRVNTKNNNHTSRTTTTKPPIYEYSYSAPGYGSIEAPKVGVNFGTTPKSLIFETNFSPVKDHQFSYFEYQSTPKPNIYDYEQTTVQPQFYTNTHRPTYEDPGDYHNIGLYKTPSSFTNGFHPQDIGLLDDITKKYFSLFGQKLNNDGLSEPLTTPLTPVQNLPKKQYFNSYPTNSQSTTERNKQNVKFPDDIYELQNDQQYYSKPQRVNIQNYRQNLRIQKPNIQPNQGYSNYYRLSSPQYQPYEEYDQGFVRPNHPLDSDIRVNYKNPPPTIDPDAEFINPAYIRPPRPRGNSFISYQLPGSGGHFYFLTPQSVKPEKYHILNTGYQYPEIENSGYFKRNTQTKPTRPRRTRPKVDSQNPIK